METILDAILKDMYWANKKKAIECILNACEFTMRNDEKHYANITMLETIRDAVDCAIKNEKLALGELPDTPEKTPQKEWRYKYYYQRYRK